MFMHRGGVTSFLLEETMFEIEVLELLFREMAMYKGMGGQALSHVQQIVKYNI